MSRSKNRERTARRNENSLQLSGKQFVQRYGCFSYKQTARVDVKRASSYRDRDLNRKSNSAKRSTGRKIYQPVGRSSRIPRPWKSYLNELFEFYANLFSTVVKTILRLSARWSLLSRVLVVNVYDPCKEEIRVGLFPTVSMFARMCALFLPRYPRNSENLESQKYTKLGKRM